MSSSRGSKNNSSKSPKNSEARLSSSPSSYSAAQPQPSSSPTSHNIAATKNLHELLSLNKNNGPSSSSSRLSAFPSISNLSSDSDLQDVLRQRSKFIFSNLLGKLVEIHLRDGKIHSGVLHQFFDADPSESISTEIVLKMVKSRDSHSHFDPTARPVPTMTIRANDFLHLYAKDVSFDLHDKEFATDTEISGGMLGDSHSRFDRLVPWQPDPSIEEIDLENDEGGKNWDQFEANQKLFGVNSTYAEEIYTTALDRSSDAYKKHIKHAEKLAKEIEGRTSSNPHMNEERGLDDGALDEEDRYSTVMRKDSGSKKGNGGTTAGKYVPPQKRGKESNNSNNSNNSASQMATSPRESRDLNNSGERTTEGSQLNRVQSKEAVSRTSSNDSLQRSPAQNVSTSERFKLRAMLTAEKLKNAAPVNSKQESETEPMPPSPKKSPLVSTLVGDPRKINSLSLDPAVPRVPAETMQDFLLFSKTNNVNNGNNSASQVNNKLGDAKRQFAINEWKNFSQRIGQKISPTPNSKNPSPTEETSPAPAAPSKASPVATDAKKTSTPSTTTTTTPTPAPASTQKSTPTTTTTPAPTSTTQPKQESQTATTTTPAPAATSLNTSANKDKDKEKDAKKLNPNAKEFKPMFVKAAETAPVFTPQQAIPVAVPQMVPYEEAGWYPQYDQMGYYPAPFQRPVYPVAAPPFVPGQQVPGMAPYPVRVPYPIPVYPQQPPVQMSPGNPNQMNVTPPKRGPTPMASPVSPGQPPQSPQGSNQVSPYKQGSGMPPYPYVVQPIMAGPGFPGYGMPPYPQRGPIPPQHQMYPQQMQPHPQQMQQPQQQPQQPQQQQQQQQQQHQNKGGNRGIEHQQVPNSGTVKFTVPNTDSIPQTKQE